jgi:hypothetical protein
MPLFEDSDLATKLMMLGAGLMSAGGPTTNPQQANLGVGLSQGLQNMTDWERAQSESVYRKAQTAELESKKEERKRLLEQQRFQRQQLERLLSQGQEGTPGTPGTPVPSAVASDIFGQHGEMTAPAGRAADAYRATQPTQTQDPLSGMPESLKRALLVQAQTDPEGALKSYTDFVQKGREAPNAATFYDEGGNPYTGVYDPGRGGYVRQGGSKAPTPNSPLAKLYQDRDIAKKMYGPNSEQARAFDELIKYERSGSEPPSLTDVRGMRQEFTSVSADFIKIRDAFGKISASAGDPSAAGDLSLIFGYMKILDPTSVVREGEQAMAQNAAGVPEQVRNFFNRILTGERLTPNQRQDFINQAYNLFGSQLESQLYLEGQYTDLAKRNLVRPENVVIDFVGKYRSGFGKSPQLGKSPPPSPSATPESSGFPSPRELQPPEVPQVPQARSNFAPSKPISQMNVMELKSLPLGQLTPEQLDEAEGRWGVLSGGR